VPKAQEALPRTFQCKGRIVLHLHAQGKASCSLRSPAPRCAWGGPLRREGGGRCIAGLAGQVAHPLLRFFHFLS